MKVTLAIILFSFIFPISALFFVRTLYFLGNVFIIYIISFCFSIFITYLIFKLWNKHKYEKLEEERIIQAEKEKEERNRRYKELEEERQRIAKEKEEERIRKAKEEEEERIRQEEEKKRVSKEIEDIIKNKRFLQTSLDNALGGEEHCYININNTGWYEPRKEGGRDVYKEIYRGNLYITNEKIILTTNSETKNISLGEIVETIEGKNVIEIRKIKGKNILFGAMTKTNIYSILIFIKEIKKIKELEYIYKEFYSNKRGLNYRIEIYAENEICKLQIYSEQEDTANDENPPECTEKWEQDNKDIKAWLEKHNLFKGFDFEDEYYRWTIKFKFPYEYTNLYGLKEKLIKLLKEDIESIYSGN